MIIPTDYNILLRDLAAYAFDPDAPAEVAAKIQLLQGTAADKLNVGMEMLYAFRDHLDIDGLTILGQLAGYMVREGWQAPGEPTRLDSIYKGVLRDLEGQVFDGLEDPQPKISYRTDSADWRQQVVPNLDQLKAAKRKAVNDLKIEKENGIAATPFGGVQNDDKSKIKMNGAVTMAMLALQNAQPFAIEWTMADNSNQPLDAMQMIQLGQAAGQFTAQVHDRSVDLKAQIEAITVDPSAEDQAAALQDAITALEAIDITSGWPV